MQPPGRFHFAHSLRAHFTVQSAPSMSAISMVSSPSTALVRALLPILTVGVDSSPHRGRMRENTFLHVRVELDRVTLASPPPCLASQRLISKLVSLRLSNTSVA